MNALRQRRSTHCWLAGLAIWAMLSTRPAFLTILPAQERIATNTIAGRASLTVTADMLPKSTHGSYRCAHIRVFNPLGPSVQDRHLEVRLRVRPSVTDDVLVFQKSLILPTGARLVDDYIAFIDLGTDFTWALDVYEDGRDIRASQQLNRSSLPFQYGRNELRFAAAFGILIRSGEEGEIDETAIGLQRLAEKRPAEEASTRGWGVARNGSVAPHLVRTYPGLSADWSHYSIADCWALQRSLLEEIIDDAPDIHRALRQYVASGGNLLVIDDALPQEVVGRFLLGETHPPSEEPSRRPDHQRPSNVPTDTISSSSPASPPHPSAASTSGIASDTVRGDAQSWPALVTSASFVGFPLGAGRVFAAQPIDTWKNDEGAKFLEALWSHLHQVRISPQIDGEWFVRHLIEDIGQPPVWMFCAIVGMFTLLIGPGLLLWARRLQRPSTLVFLIPVVSCLTTAFILGYSVMYEGFSSHLRVTSLTRFRSETGEGFSWSRQSLFSGWLPDEGVKLPGSVLARPVTEPSAASYRYGSPRQGPQAIIRFAEGYQFWHGWLKPRTQQQLFVVAPVDNLVSPLRITRRGPGQLRVTNTCAHELPFVVVRDHNGEWYHTTALARGQAVDLNAQPPGSSTEGLASIVRELMPLPPPELFNTTPLWSFTFGYNRVHRVVQEPMYSPGKGPIGSVLSELASGRAPLAPGEFLTAIPEHPRLPLALADEPSQGLHLVIGGGPW
ncbi:MAG: hypothetical protein KatS3mg111_1991 [Pirellulaceae bacterium]|nr:MAG: hypothetical protein KatS3mg111_1991 [Pirellulaceae bacterium]